MISITINDKSLIRHLNNVVQYGEGFLDGVRAGKQSLMANIGLEMQELVSQYIDSTARVNPASLHHVYEWYKTGSPDARLFDIDYLVKGNGLSMNATFRQSESVQNNSSIPFRNKAYIMENGISVTIKPKNSPVLAFEQGGETVFTRSEVNVQSPGGNLAQGSFEQTFKEFFRSSLSQSIIMSSGIGINLRNPVDFKRNFAAGSRGGRAVGISSGQTWISRKA